MPLPTLRTLCSFSIAATLLMACATLDDESPATVIAPMPGLGATTFTPTARDEQARAWFAQGLLLTYAFEHKEAVRVFRAALARDSSCAMCAWGVAYALGPNINNPDRGPERDIRRYIKQAQQAASAVTPKERALIEAMAVRYGRAADNAQQLYEARGSAMCSARSNEERKVDPQERAYAAAMTDVVEKYPDDPDVVALYADAVMSTLSWNWWDPKTGQPNGAVGDVITRLSSITRKHPQHPGALHFYVHVAEHSPDPRQAEVAADALGLVAPESPHLVHMGSHIYKNIGRFADGARANEQALEVQKRFDAVLKAQGVQRSGRWDGHHMHFLWYSALMEGRTALSLRTARDYAERFGRKEGSVDAEYALMLPLITLVRLQRWDEVLAEPPPKAGLGLHQGYAAFARGMAQMHAGRLDPARVELANVDRLRQQPSLQQAKMYGEAVPAKFLALVHDLLAGSIARAERRHGEASALLSNAADLDDELGNDPPPLGGGARLALAGALLEAGQLDEASKAITVALRLNGPSTWSHQSLTQLAELRGAHEQSQRHAELARTAWKNAEGAVLPRP